MNVVSRTVTTRVRLAALVTGDVSVLCAARPHPHALARISTHPAAALARLGVDHAVILFALAALWLAAAWVAVGLLAVVGTALPGAIGRACAAVATVTLPAAARRVLVGAIGIGMLAGPTTAAFAAPAHGTPCAHSGRSASVSSRVLHPGDRKPGPSWPTSTPSHPRHHTSERHAPERSAGSHDVVRVHAGDSLWLIAAHRLGGGAPAGRIAAYWPRVYADNRSVVGPDPGLVTPGQVLHLPDPRTS